MDEQNDVAWRRQAFDLIDKYQKRLTPDYSPKRMDTSGPLDQNFGSGLIPLQHAHWMLETLPNYVDPTNKGKFYRWLGFIQGVFMSFGIYTIDEIKKHNR